MSHTDPHPTWCAADHRCNLGEHRAHPIPIEVTAEAGGVLTRVRDRAGRDHAEIRLRLPLHHADPIARHQLAHLLAHLADLLTRTHDLEVTQP